MRSTINQSNCQQTETVTERLIRLGSVGNTYFHDKGEPYVCFDSKNSSKATKVRSKAFTMMLQKRYFVETGQIPQPDQLNQAKIHFEGFATLSDKQHSVETRIGEHKGNFYYDLNISGGKSIVEISKAGWRLIQVSPVYFRTSQNMLPQVVPSAKGNVKLLLKHVRFKSKADKLLYLVYVISCFVYGIPHPILILSGEKGAAKSTSTRMTRSIVDPASNDILFMQTAVRELAITLQNNYMPAFDNLTSISEKISDLLCVAATGGGYSTRKMYSDDEETILSFKRCIILNGINVVASKADLLDRCILLELARIDESERKAEQEVWQEFNDDKPAILSGIFTVLSKALQIRPTVKLAGLQRMGDFSIWGYAIAEAIKPGLGDSFLKAYSLNIKRASEEATSAHPVASAIIAMMRKTDYWQGSVTELLGHLEDVASRERIDIRNKVWPKGPHVLSRRINEILSNLKQCGISVEIRHGGDFKVATVEKIGIKQSNAKPQPAKK